MSFKTYWSLCERPYATKDKNWVGPVKLSEILQFFSDKWNLYAFLNF